MTALRSIAFAVFSLWLMGAASAMAQNDFQIRASLQEEETLVSKILGKPIKGEDSLTLRSGNEIARLLIPFQKKGYLNAKIDSVKSDSLNKIAYVHLGSYYRFAKIKPGNVDEEVISEIGFSDKLFFNKNLEVERLVELEESILRVCENSGYPFALIQLDSAVLENESLSGSLNLVKGNFIKIDSLVLRGDADVSLPYICSYIGIKAGSPYNESLIRSMSQRLKEISFVRQTQASELEFGEYGCKVILHLNKRKASNVSGILGFLPDDKNPAKIRLSGETLLNLRNPFGNGEAIDLSWKSPQAQTQDLKVRLAYPFIVSRFGLDLGFALYKRDSSFLDVIQDAGVQYLLPQGNFIKAFVTNRNSKTQNNASYTSESNPFATVKSILYGLGFRSDRLDYKYNPRKGYSLKASAGTGLRTIDNKASGIRSETASTKSTQYQAQYEGELFIPLIGRSVLDLGINGAKLISPSYYQNELFRIGGFKTLRGFDEESIFASSYDIVKIELRYLLEQNSYLSAFWNGAYYENRAATFQGDPFDMPYGFGTAIAFDTKMGVFSLSYALGKQFDNPIEVRAGKVSFGLVNNF